MNQMPEWTIILGNFGFPIAITIYLFVRFEKKIESLEKIIIQLGETIRESKRE